MDSVCPYCEWSGTSQGIKSHVRMAHPDLYARWQFDHVDSTKGKIRKDLLRPNTVQEKAWYGRLKRAQAHDDAKKMVLVDGNMQPNPKDSEAMKPDAPRIQNVVDETKFQCGNCQFCFNEPIWDDNEAHCPQCEEVLNSEAMYDEDTDL